MLLNDGVNARYNIRIKRLMISHLSLSTLIQICKSGFLSPTPKLTHVFENSLVDSLHLSFFDFEGDDNCLIIVYCHCFLLNLKKIFNFSKNNLETKTF